MTMLSEPATTAEIVRLATEGRGDDAIARKLGITRHRVRMVLTENALISRSLSKGATEAKEVDIDQILVPEGRRAAAPDKVRTIAEGIDQSGLINPITVRENKNGAGFILVSGRHRTEAFRLLGRPTIPAFVMPVSTTEAEARMLEISENLHRVELTVQERSDQIAEWIKLAKEKREVSRQVAAKPQGGRPESGTRAATRDLGIEDREARRAVKIASIIPAAKEAARAAGIDDNQSKLLKVAEATAADQIALVHKLAAKPETADPEARDAQLAVADLKTAVATLVKLNAVHGSQHESYECASGSEMFLDVVSEKDLEAAAGFLSDVKYTIREKKETSEKSKRLKWEAKHPDKAREKARDEAIRAAMDSDMEDAKQEAKENEERWGGVKDEWMEQWEADNWGTEEEAEFEADFRRVWKSDHGTDFPEPQVDADAVRAINAAVPSPAPSAVPAG